MFDKIKAEWDLMWSKGTILWARLKLALGLLWSVVTQSGVDLSTVITHPKVLLATKVGGAFLLMDGAVSEFIRRHNANL